LPSCPTIGRRTGGAGYDDVSPARATDFVQANRPSSGHAEDAEGVRDRWQGSRSENPAARLRVLAADQGEDVSPGKNLGFFDSTTTRRPHRRRLNFDRGKMGYALIQPRMVGSIER
jgi:hypothetical protein